MTLAEIGLMRDRTQLNQWQYFKRTDHANWYAFDYSGRLMEVVDIHGRLGLPRVEWGDLIADDWEVQSTANDYPVKPVILPEPQKLIVIPAGQLKVDNIVVGYQSWKVDSVEHTSYGYTYWQGRTLTGPAINRRHCVLSCFDITVEAR